MQQSLFKENTATYSGGAIDMKKTRGSLVNCTFEKNSLKGLSDKISFGGAIASQDRSNITVQESLFKENTATYSGGAIYMQKTRGSFLHCTFERNFVKRRPENIDFGGAISVGYFSYLTMHQCIFIENRAAIDGGATFIQDSQSSFQNCTFEGKV